LFKFWRRRNEATVEASEVSESSENSETFLQATGGGWSDPPEVISIDGGAQAGYVDLMLAQARAYALAKEIPIGQEFEFTITDIPNGISSPHEITFGLMMQAGRFGLEPGPVMNETVRFTRIE
jgi:hypothetical protein